MDSIKITKNEDNDAVTLTKDEFEELCNEIIDENNKNNSELSVHAKLMELMVNTKFYLDLKKKIFKEDN